MKEDIEFQEFGKKLPYRVPEDFFEKLPGKTLQEARKREQDSRRKVIALRAFAVAASLAAVAFLGYFEFRPEKPQVVEPAELVVVSPHGHVGTMPDSMPKTSQISDRKVPAPETSEKVKSDENLSDVLADMSDDELLQLAAMYKSDTFLNESTN